MRDPIAVIGIGCRFPGASGPDGFWQLLRDGLDAIGNIPRERFNFASLYDPRPGTPGKIVARQGGFLNRVGDFDAGFFDISPREAIRMDPQQRLLLEIACEAADDAGLSAEALTGSSTGVFIGACSTDYEDLQYYHRDRRELDMHVAAGSARSVLSGRLSFFFDLHGPSVTVDTACSSSLVATHLACQSIWSGECRMAIAGGVNLILLPEMSLPFSRAQMLAPDSRCKFGDALADGFTRSDGAGVVILKPLKQALEDRDSIYCVVRGSAISNNGRSDESLLTPSRAGQEAVLREAYRNAGIEPASIHYVEAHGTGTVVGDPIEIASLGAVLGENRLADSPCYVGSLKSNIGHTEGAAGIAGVIKAALCLKHRFIAPSLHYHRPNPAISWDQLPLVIPKALTPWPQTPGPARAGVSAFGISATNAHVVLEEAPPLPDPGTHPQRPQLLTLSARSLDALRAMATEFVPFAAAATDLESFCYTASARRTHHECRLALAADHQDRLVEGLQDYVRGENSPYISTGQVSAARKPRIAFIFPGQGSQWSGMGRQLLAQEPVFRAVIEKCEQAFRPHLNWSLIENILCCDETESRFNQIDVIQPALFAVQVALAALWQSLGVRPQAVIGQSMGEVAAGYIAGALSLKDAAQIICRRSSLLKRISGQGGMAVVALPLNQASEALRGHEESLSIAVSTGPDSTVIAGDNQALAGLLEALDRRGIYSQLIKVDVASHSPQVEPLREDLLAALVGIAPRRATVPFYSTVTGEANAALLLDEKYWLRNLREPVRFMTAANRLVEDGYDYFIEISPHPVLAGPLQQIFESANARGSVLPSMRANIDERATLLESLGVLYAAGCDIKWKHLYSPTARLVTLPSYPWQRENFWVEPQERVALSNDEITSRQNACIKRQSLLTGPPLESAAQSGCWYWELELSTSDFAYLNHHRAQGEVVLPAAAYVEMALAAATRLFGARLGWLEHLRFKKAIFLTEQPLALQLVVSRDNSRTISCAFYSRTSRDAAWTLNATGLILLKDDEAAAEIPNQRALETGRAGCPGERSRAAHYTALGDAGLQYGESFQGIAALWQKGSEATARIELPEPIRNEQSNYQIHPVLLDSCFQTLAATVLAGKTAAANRLAYLPVSIDRLQIYDAPQDGAWSHAALRAGLESSTGQLKGDVQLLDESGKSLVQITGLALQPIEGIAQSNDQQVIAEWFFKTDWLEQSNAGDLSTNPADAKGLWLIFSDRAGTGAALAQRLTERGATVAQVMAGDEFQTLAPDRFVVRPDRADDYLRLLESLKLNSTAWRGIAHLWSLDAIPADGTVTDLENAQRLGCASALLLVQAIISAAPSTPPRLWLVTGGAQPAGTLSKVECPAQAPLWGFGLAVMHEQPELRCSMVDLDLPVAAQEAEMLSAELTADSNETHIVIRGYRRFVARLAHHFAERIKSAEAETGDEPVKAAQQVPFELASMTPGLLDELVLRANERKRPAAGQLEIEVAAAGLNFRDVMLASGTLPVPEGEMNDFGWECAGTVVAVGEGVEGFRPGDEVLALCPSAMRSFAVTNAALVSLKPACLDTEAAAAMPLAFVTAHHALVRLAQLQAGERVLIHCATGGVGMAAIQIARLAGAEIFATAGCPEKRSLLEQLGVDHIFDSRSPAFAEKVMAATNNQGVDVVLNSLSGEFISAGLSVLREGGRFVELGRRDIYENRQLGLMPFQKGLSFFALDLARLIRQRPAFVGATLREVIELFDCGKLKPLPLRAFSINEASDAFRLMAQAGHTGKLVLRMDANRISAQAALPRRSRLRPQATYLITGGAGGLGLAVAQWLIDNGARHIALLIRNEPTIAAHRQIEILRAKAEIIIAKADVSESHDVRKVIEAIKADLPPLRGIIHAAGLLDDGVIAKLSPARLSQVMAPKVKGSWNLHTFSLDAPLDFFVLFSSAAAVLGSGGQANYCAANSFLDALAHYRRSVGLPALSINWGPWSETGLAARPDRGERLQLRGLASMTPAQGIAAFDLLMQQSAAQLAVVPFDLENWRQFYPAVAGTPLFCDLECSDPKNATSDTRLQKPSTIKDELLAATASQRPQLITAYLSKRLERILGLSPARRSRISEEAPLNRLGLDSLMAIEMKTLIRVELGVEVPTVSFFRGCSLADLTRQILSDLGASKASINQETRIGPPNIDSAGAAIQWEELSI